MMHWLKKMLYKSNPVSALVYKFVFRKWIKRFKTKDNFIFKENVHQYLQQENIHIYHASELVSFKAPVKAEDDFKTPAQMEFYANKTFTLPQGQVYVYPKAYLLGNEAVGVTPNGAIISDTALDEPVVLHKCNPRLIMNYDAVAVDASKEWCVSLVHIFSSNTYVNYFHWLTDSLILLEGVQHLEKKLNKKIKIIVNKNRTDFQNQYLNLLGYTHLDIIEWEYTKLEVHNLVVVQSRRVGVNRDEVLSPTGLHWLREKFVPLASNTFFGEKIYITRKNSSCRRVLNEHELLPTLHSLGFVSVDLDSLSVQDQIALFSKAKIVISPHGAGLLNMIYAQNLKIIELMGNLDQEKDYYWYAAYYSISNVLNFEYSFLNCTAKPIYKNENGMRQLYDIEVDVKILEKLINKFLH